MTAIKQEAEKRMGTEFETQTENSRPHVTMHRGRPFAAVVSDIMMPNMDGLTLTAHIRAEPRYREMPVITVTSLASDDDRGRGLDAGANACIPKPTFDQRVLLDTLRRLVVL